MASKINMPPLSETMEFGKILRWLKAEGETVQAGEAIAEVESDKAILELTAYASGTLRQLLINEGERARVGQLIAVIGDPAEDISNLLNEPSVASKAESFPVTEPALVAEFEASVTLSADSPAEPAWLDEIEETAPAAAPPQSVRPAPAGRARIKASPLARRLAEEAGLNLAEIAGTGPGGRILSRDIAVETITRETTAEPSGRTTLASLPPLTAPPAPRAGEFTVRPFSASRRGLIQQLEQNARAIPTAYLTIEVDMAKAMELHEQVNKLYGDCQIGGIDLIVKATALALLKHPAINASFTAEALIEYHRVHIGLTETVEAAQFTPIIRDADRKSLRQIAHETKRLTAPPHDTKSAHEPAADATFFIADLGHYGLEEFSVLVNPPAAAALAVGDILTKPVVEHGQVTIGQRLRLTLACDQRVIDSASGAAFLDTLKKILEHPVYLIA